MRLGDKIALITEAAHGLDGTVMGFGGAAARVFAREGASVALTDIDDERLRPLRRCCRPRDTVAEPWVPLGVGLHTGVAFVGSKESTTDITVLGDAPNTAARLSSSAAPGEILISEATGLNVGQIENRTLGLKGERESVVVYVFSSTARSSFRTRP